MKDMELQMRALDDFVTRARSQNAQHHDSHAQSLQSLSGTVKSSYSNIGSHFASTHERVRALGDEMSTKTATLQDSLEPLDSVLRKPLSTLRENITSTQLQDYQPTGETPQKVQYSYPTALPRTEAHETLLAALRRPSSSSSGMRSPSKSTTSTVPVIFNDTPSTLHSQLREFSASVPAGSSRPREHDQRPTTSGSTGLREIDINVTSVPAPSASSNEEQVTSVPSFKRSVTANRGNLPVLKSGKKSVVPAEGRENTNILAQSTGRRRSPRTG
jgi:kinesin family protein 11